MNTIHSRIGSAFRPVAWIIVGALAFSSCSWGSSRDPNDLGEDSDPATDVSEMLPADSVIAMVRAIRSQVFVDENGRPAFREFFSSEDPVLALKAAALGLSMEVVSADEFGEVLEDCFGPLESPQADSDQWVSLIQLAETLLTIDRFHPELGIRQRLSGLSDEVLAAIAESASSSDLGDAFISGLREGQTDIAEHCSSVIAQFSPGVDKLDLSSLRILALLNADCGQRVVTASSVLAAYEGEESESPDPFLSYFAARVAGDLVTVGLMDIEALRELLGAVNESTAASDMENPVDDLGIQILSEASLVADFVGRSLDLSSPRLMARVEEIVRSRGRLPEDVTGASFLQFVMVSEALRILSESEVESDAGPVARELESVARKYGGWTENEVAALAVIYGPSGDFPFPSANPDPDPDVGGWLVAHHEFLECAAGRAASADLDDLAVWAESPTDLDGLWNTLMADSASKCLSSESFESDYVDESVARFRSGGSDDVLMAWHDAELMCAISPGEVVGFTISEEYLEQANSGDLRTVYSLLRLAEISLGGCEKGVWQR